MLNTPLEGSNKKRGGQEQASPGGLILDVSGAMAESMGLKLGEGSGTPKRLGFPHDMIEGEMQSLRAIAETKSVRRQVSHAGAPSPSPISMSWLLRSMSEFSCECRYTRFQFQS